LTRVNDLGFSLLELIAVLMIIAITAVVTMPLIHEQLAVREMETIARKWIAHAQFARQQALQMGEPIRIAPYAEGEYEQGWVIRRDCFKKKNQSCNQVVLMSQGKIDPIFFRDGSKQFRDPHSGEFGILFNAAGAAKTTQGGFVANRLILAHRRIPSLERHLILGSGGRWRICDPVKDARRCH
jgi:type IV fimbrial biogenesis protein FimT